MALSEVSLTTVDEIRDAFGESFSEPAAIARIERIIRASSLECARICGRPLHYAQDAKERFVLRGSRRRIDVARMPILDLISVSVNASDVVVDDVELINDSTLILPYDVSGTVIAEFDGGWVTPGQETVSLARTLPDDIEQACIELCVSRLRARGTDIREYNRGGGEVTSSRSTVGVPEQVNALLSPYILAAVSM